MLSLLDRCRKWKDLCLTTQRYLNKIRKQWAIQEPQVCYSALPNLYEKENSNCCLKLVPKEKESMDCIPVNLSSSWGSLGGREKTLQRWVRSQAGLSRFLQWLEGDKGWLQAQFGCLKNRGTNLVYSVFPLQLITAQSCVFLPSAPCRWLWLSRDAYIMASMMKHRIFKTTVPCPTPKTLLNL